MSEIRFRAFLSGFTIAVLSLIACDSTHDEQITTNQPVSNQPGTHNRLAFGELAIKPIQYDRIPFQFDGVVKSPRPMPGRLLVKVKNKDISWQYTSLRPGDKITRQRYPYLRKFPKELVLGDAQELYQHKDGSALLSLQLEKATSLTTIQQLLLKSPFKLYQLTPFKRSERTVIPRVVEKRVNTILVEVQLDQFTLSDRRLGFRRYSQLIYSSELHKVFHEVDVRSLRRVFRMVEKPVTKDSYQVVPVKKLMQQAKSKFPQRAARGYEQIQLPENMENWFLLQLNRDAKLEELSKKLKQRPEIEAVLFDYAVKQHLPPDQEPSYNSQWALQSTNSWGIDVQPVWGITESNPAVTVGVIGSGIKEDLDEFSGRIWRNPDEIPNNGVDDDANGYIDDMSGITTANVGMGTAPPVVVDTHETKVAGIIAAAVNSNLITGVAGNADVRLMNISLGLTWGCTELAEAIQYATLEGADVINMSLGSPRHTLVTEAIQNALSSQGGIVLVASAGNNKTRVSQNYSSIGAYYPAWYDGVIAVGGSDANGHLWSEVGTNTGSNYGVGLDLVAPAKDVNTITFSSMAQTAAEPAMITGTSASAPLVSGVAALLIGKYPNLTADQVRSWLRATSTDITDPLGSGDNLQGDDLYTGAGLLTASQAVTTAQPDPVIADLYVERIGNRYSLNAGISNAVAENPSLGITVRGGISGTWELHYGVGDWPDIWNPITVPAALNGVIDIPRTEGPSSFYTDVPDIFNGVSTRLLNTEGLQNRQVYTMRLRVSDAQGQVYTSYDWFMPIRAMIIYPVKNAPVPIRWGWPEIDGIVDTRSGATYSLSIAPISGPVNPDWQLTGLTPMLWQNWTQENRDANYVRLAVATGTYGGVFPEFSVPPSGEGWHEIRLEVRSPGGAIEVDTQQVYLDDSAFNMRTGWPVASSPYAGNSVNPRGIVAVDMDGNGLNCIITHQQSSFRCLSPAGNTLWELPLFSVEDNTPVRYPPSFLVEDLDADGVKEVAVASYNPDGGPVPPVGSPNQKLVFLLKPDGSLYNANWPVSYPITDYRYDELGKLSAGDIDGDGVKEIIFYEITEADLPDRLHVLNLNGQALPGWPVDIDYNNQQVPVVADIDADGKAEIILDVQRAVYEDAGQLKPGWAAADLVVSTYYWGGLQVRELDGSSGMEIIEYGRATLANEQKYAIDLREHDGSRLPGNWPAYLDAPVNQAESASFGSISNIYVDSAQLLPGGAPEIVVAYDKIQVLDTSGNLLAALPEIVLNGQARGVKVMDVDGDGALEYVVLVLKFEDDDGWKTRAYGNLEAYELDGSPLSTTDNRWPIRVAFDSRMSLGNTVTIEDIDGDGRLEVINFLGHHPHRHWNNLNYSSQTGQILPRMIEVLDIR